MSGNLNKVFLLGNLTRDPELRHTATGTSVCSFSIAVNRSFKGADGEFKKEVGYHNIVVWGKTGENCAKYLAKGRPVLVEGRLSNRSYEDKEGKKCYVTEIIADNAQFLGTAADNKPAADIAAPDGFGDGWEAAAEDSDAVPF